MQYDAEFFTLGEARTGIYNLLVTHVCDNWMLALSSSTSNSEQIEAMFSSLRANWRLLLQGCLFGPVHKKNLRLGLQLQCFCVLQFLIIVVIVSIVLSLQFFVCVHLSVGLLKKLKFLLSLWETTVLRTDRGTGKLKSYTYTTLTTCVCGQTHVVS